MANKLELNEFSISSLKLLLIILVFLLTLGVLTLFDMNRKRPIKCIHEINLNVVEKNLKDIARILEKREFKIEPTIEPKKKDWLW